MAHDESPWKFPCCTAVALGLLLVFCFVVPARWWESLWPPLHRQDTDTDRVARPVIHLLPPPVIAVVPIEIVEDEMEPEEEEEAEPQWWEEAWRGRVFDLAIVFDASAGATRDSAAVRLETLGLDLPVRMETLLAADDSTVTARLAILRTLTPQRWDEVRLYLQGVTFGEIHREIAQQAAAIFGESILTDIPVTTSPDDRRR